jgi:DNA-binding protein HU-beta
VTVDEWRTTATAIMLPPVKFDNNRLFLGYVKNQVRFRIRLFKFNFWGKWRTKNCYNLEILQLRCHKERLDMTKTELQVALAAATETNKRTAGVFLDTLSNVAYKAVKKNGEFVLPGFGKLVKQKRKARVGFNPKTQQKIKIPAKTVVKFRVAKAAKDAILGVKK